MTEFEALIRDSSLLSFADLDDSTQRHIKLVVADTFGVIVGGHDDPEVARVVRQVSEARDGGPGAEILSRGFPRADYLRAAFANGYASSVLEFDEGSNPTGHPATHVLPAAFAVAQKMQSTGIEFLEAFLAGYEVTAELFQNYELTFPIQPHANFGIVGAAVAVAKLRGVDPISAATIAANLPLVSTWETSLEGSHVQCAFLGMTAVNAIIAVNLALSGVQGSPAANATLYEKILSSRRKSLAPERNGLNITRNYFKHYSSCGRTHAAISAALQLGKFESVDIERIDLVVPEGNLVLKNLPSANALSAKFSLPYAVATALIHGSAGPAQFQFDSAVFQLASRVFVTTYAETTNLSDVSDQAAVTVSLRDGRTLRAEALEGFDNRTTPTNPKLIQDKFRQLVGSSRHSIIEWETLLNLERLQQIA